MHSPVLTIEGLGKRYLLTHRRAEGDGLRHEIEQAARAPLKWWRDRQQRGHDHLEAFWALKDVSFAVKEGEVLGIIGRNGAGKSTLLKILSRITEPTTGRIRIKGRVASLLEVGTGFHPELTGRENIFLNGAILGMTRLEIKAKFDEIVAFSEIAKFLDTPVKRYSSGMYVRLAFAVAAHLEPDILVIDEVLAVGDVEFQKKCLGKMNEVAHTGRTVLFVSHNLVALRQLCTQALLLEKGQITFTGGVAETLQRYISAGGRNAARYANERPPAPDSRGRIEEICARNPAGELSGRFRSSEAISFTFRVLCTEPIASAQLAVRFTNAEGVIVFTTTNADWQDALTTFAPGEHRLGFSIPPSFLAGGFYTVTAALCVPGIDAIDTLLDVISFEVVEGINHATKFQDQRRGVVTPMLNWSHAVA